MLLEDVILRGNRAGQPVATAVPTGTLYCVTDEDDIIERSSGAAWEAYSPAAAVSGINQLTGDVTAGPGTGSQAATIPNGTVTYAKMQDVSATSRILGRRTSGSGDVEECTIEQILNFIASLAQGDILYYNGTNFVRLPAGNNGEFLQTQGAGANPQWAAASGGGSWDIVRKTSTTSRSSTTVLAADPTLTFSLAANKIYAVRGLILVQTSSAPDFAYRLTGPASPTQIAIRREASAPPGTSVSDLFMTAFDGSDQSLQGSGTDTYGFIVIEGLISNGANAGSFTLEWAQRVSDVGNTSVLASSYFEYKQLN